MVEEQLSGPGILSLPTELLEQIFHLVAVSSSEVELARHFRNASWIALTHVCCRLRFVALGCALLWTNVRVDLGTCWTNAFLDRSRDAPLTYSGLFRAIKQSTNHLKLAAQMHRVREMYIGCHGEMEAEKAFWCLVLSAPAPVLRRCTLFINEPSLDLHAVDLFASNTPHLRQLFVVSHAPFPWHSSALDNLVQFEIATSTSGSVGATSTDLLQALRRMRRIEWLSINIEVTAQGWDRAPITLSYLRHLILRLPCETLACILTHTRLPYSAHILLEGRDLDPALTPAFAQSLSSIYDPSSVIFGQAAVKRYLAPGYSRLTISASRSSDSAVDPPPHLTLELSWPTPDAMDEATETIYAALPLESVRALTLDGHWCADRIRAIFQRSRAVAYLRMHVASVPACVAALSRGAGPPALFPALELLSFPDCTWTEWSLIPLNESRQIYELLALAARRRREDGRPLRGVLIGEEGSKTRRGAPVDWAYHVALRLFPTELKEILKQDQS